MNKFDKQHQLNVRKYQRRIDAIYKKAAEEAAARAASLPVPDDYIFTFDDFPAIKKQIDALQKQVGILSQKKTAQFNCKKEVEQAVQKATLEAIASMK